MINSIVRVILTSAWRLGPLIPEQQRQCYLPEIKASLVYMVRSRPSGAIGKLCFKKKRKNDFRF